MKKEHMALIAVVLVISCFGLAFASEAQNSYQGNSTNSTGFHWGGKGNRHRGNESNYTGQDGEPPRFFGNMTNGTMPEPGMFGRWEGEGNMTNWTAQEMPGRGANGTFNETAMKDFDAAVLAGDYTAASSLHQAYGMGGPIFGKLNATTFAQYSQIQNLQHELAKELGLNSTGPGLGVNFLPGPMENNGFASRGRTRNVAYHQTPNAVPG